MAYSPPEGVAAARERLGMAPASSVADFARPAVRRSTPTVTAGVVSVPGRASSSSDRPGGPAGLWAPGVLNFEGEEWIVPDHDDDDHGRRALAALPARRRPIGHL